MPRKKGPNAEPPVKQTSAPEIKNNGKVTTKEGEAIQIERAVEIDTKPSIPTIPKKDKPKKVAEKPQEVKEQPLDTALSANNKQNTLSRLEQKMIDLGCSLSDRLMGEDGKIYGESLSEKQVASIKSLIDLYNALKS